MKAKKQPQNHAQVSQERELPIEAFARLVEGLDADAIEKACARDGAPPGGVPPAWSDPAGFTRYLAARCGAAPKSSAARDCEERPSMGALLEEFTVATDGRLFARHFGAPKNERGESMALEILSGSPREGDWVAADIPGVGKLLRELRFVGGAALLCDPSGARLAVPVDEELMPLLRAMKASRTTQ